MSDRAAKQKTILRAETLSPANIQNALAQLAAAGGHMQLPVRDCIRLLSIDCRHARLPKSHDKSSLHPPLQVSSARYERPAAVWQGAIG